MKPKFLTLVMTGLLSGALVTAVSVPVWAEEYSGNPMGVASMGGSNEMAEAMWDMMDWFRQGENTPFNTWGQNMWGGSMPGMPFPGSQNGQQNPWMNGVPNMMSGWPGSENGQWGGMPSYMNQMPMMNQLHEAYQTSPWPELQQKMLSEPFIKGENGMPVAMPGMKNNPQQAQIERRLDGVWQGQSGEYFLIRGDVFRLISPEGENLDGTLRIQGGRVQTRINTTGQVLEYEYVKIGDMLMLRDERDQTLVFNRVQR